MLCGLLANHSPASIQQQEEVHVHMKIVLHRTAFHSQRDYELQESEARSHAATQSKPRAQRPKFSERKPLTERTENRPIRHCAADTVALPQIYNLNPLFNVPHPKLNSYSYAMDIWFQWMVPNASPSYIVFNVANPLPSFVASSACQSQAAQHCIAAAAYTSLNLHQRQVSSTARLYEEEQTRHTFLAISKLKDEVDSTRVVGDIPSTVNAVVLLALLSYFRGDFDAGNVHRKALQTLFALSPNPDDRAEWDRKFGGLMLHMSAWIDLMEDRPNMLGIVIDHQKWSILTSAVYQSNPRTASKVTSRLPVGFERLISQGSLSDQTLVVITRFSYACEYGLSAVPQSAERFPDFSTAVPCLAGPGASFERCLVLALFCYSRRRWTSQQSQVAGMICHTIARTKLVQMLPLISDEGDERVVECLVWIWMVAIYAYCLEGSVLKQEGLDHLSMFKSHFPNWQSWEKVRGEILPSFFWREEDSNVLQQAWQSK